MVKLGQLQSGDIVMVNDEGLMREGTVVHTMVKSIWLLLIMDPGILVCSQDIFPVALDEAQLVKFGFEKGTPGWKCHEIQERVSSGWLPRNR
jgi:hypothetical protein